MGLTLIVGVLAEQIGFEDEDAIKHYREQFAKVNRALRASGLPEHHEPEDLGEADPLEMDMSGYSSLHYLRRIAAHLWAGNPLPPPGNKEVSKDPVVKTYYAAFDRISTAPRRGLFRRGGEKQAAAPKFEHLMNHSDAEGFYVPVEFERVIFDTRGLGLAGGMLGSSQKLLQECGTLAEALSMPLDLDPESDELGEAIQHQGEGDAQWKRYGIESFTCSRLYHACKASLRLGAALTFG